MLSLKIGYSNGLNEQDKNVNGIIKKDPQLIVDRLTYLTRVENVNHKELSTRLEKAKNLQEEFKLLKIGQIKRSFGKDDDKKDKKDEEDTRRSLYDAVTSNFEVSNVIKKHFELKYGFKGTSNAYLKQIELLYRFSDSIPDDKKSIVYFDNASFPGMFVFATQHWVSNHRKNIDFFDWYASSLILKKELLTRNVDKIIKIKTDMEKAKLENKKNKKQDDEDPLDDGFYLYENYRHRWLMSEENNGDLTDIKNIDYTTKKIPPVDLYTSDLGMNFSKDYSKVEETHFAANIGQILDGLKKLKVGGWSWTKQFGYFYIGNVVLLWYFYNCFEETFISKPETSKPDNSEIYLVGKKLKKESKMWIAEIEKMLENETRKEKDPDRFKNIEITSEEEFNVFLNSIQSISSKIYERQIEKLKDNHNKFKEFLEWSRSALTKKGVYEYKDVYNWFKDQPVKTKLTQQATDWIKRFPMFTNSEPLASTRTIILESPFLLKFPADAFIIEKSKWYLNVSDVKKYLKLAIKTRIFFDILSLIGKTLYWKTPIGRKNIEYLIKIIKCITPEMEKELSLIKAESRREKIESEQKSANSIITFISPSKEFLSKPRASLEVKDSSVPSGSSLGVATSIIPKMQCFKIIQIFKKKIQDLDNSVMRDIEKTLERSILFSLNSPKVLVSELSIELGKKDHKGPKGALEPEKIIKMIRKYLEEIIKCFRNTSIDIQPIEVTFKSPGTFGAKYNDITFSADYNPLVEIKSGSIWKKEYYPLTITDKNLVVPMLLNYNNVSISGGQQWSVPPKFFELIYKRWNVFFEGFASPLNSRALGTEKGKFFSLFPSDIPFGSMGNFFENILNVKSKTGNLIVNPPFERNIIDKLIEMIPLLQDIFDCIFVILPDWKDMPSIKVLTYLSKNVIHLEEENHQYYASNGKFIRAKFNSNIYFVSSEESLSKGQIIEILESFAVK